MMDTVTDLIRRYENERLPFASDETIRSYRRVFKILHQRYGPRTLGRMQASEWILPWKDSSSGAKRHAAVIIRALCRFGSVSMPDLPRHKAQPHPRLQDEQLAKTLGKSEGEMPIAFEIGVSFGLRVGDIAKLKPSDLTPSGVKVRTQKTGVDLTFEPSEAVRAFFQSKAGEKWLFDLGRASDRTSALRRRMSAYKNKLGVDGVIHSLRKTAACIVAEEGGTDADIQALLGHKTPRMAALYRAEAQSSQMRKKAAQSLQGRLRNIGGAGGNGAHNVPDQGYQ